MFVTSQNVISRYFSLLSSLFNRKLQLSSQLKFYCYKIFLFQMRQKFYSNIDIPRFCILNQSVLLWPTEIQMVFVLN